MEIKYFITEEGNQGLTWEEDNQRITEIHDRKYRFRDFLKPTLIELGMMVWEIPFFSVPILATADFPESFGYAAIPQALTYLGFRALELFGGERFQPHIRGAKMRGKRVLERKVEKLNDEVAA